MKDLTQHLEHRAVWLPEVIMVPSDTNFHAAILSRIEEVIPNYRSRMDYDQPNKELMGVIYDACMVWPGNLEKRAPYLDTDTYALEKKRVEYTRAVYPKRLQKFFGV